MAACTQCGRENPDEARFCNSCAAPLLTTHRVERRKPATLLFCDMSGSTSLGERLDPESVRDLMFRYFHEMRAAIERHGGTVEKFVGDAVMAIFGVPTAHEDDALRAVRAALDMKDHLVELNEELARRFGSRIALRIGLNTGEVVAGDATTGATIVTGDAVNVAARLEQMAAPGEILIGEETYKLVREAVSAEPVEPLALKGKAMSVPAYRLATVVPAPAAARRRLDRPLVGRRRELALLGQAFAEVCSNRSCRLETVLGQPGVGKSRLATEFISGAAAEASVLTGRCLPYGEGITYWPVAEAIREAAGIRDEDPPEQARSRISALLEGEDEAAIVAERLAGATGLAAAEASTEEIAWAVRRVLESVARRRPLVVLFDDIHWAEPAFLDLLEQVERQATDSPILLLCLARPDLLDVRPGWRVKMRLEPLGGIESERVIANLLGEAQLAAEVRDRIAAGAEGNPLFVEELVAMLIDEGLLVRREGVWVATTDLRTVSIPPTINALLAARLDRLGDSERATIERGAVEGQVFHRGSVLELSDDGQHLDVPASLEALAAKELLQPARASFAGDAAYRFRHILIRDAAYGGMPKKLRAALHERFAGWLERTSGARASEYEEILGYHLEQAYHYHAELGPVDEAGRNLARRAAERLARSGRRAVGRRDLAAAAGLLTRASDLLDPNDPLRLEVLADLADAAEDGGDFARADELLGEVIERARAAGEEGLETRARLHRLHTAVHAGRVEVEEVLREAEGSITVFERLGEDRGLAYAWALAGRMRFWLGSAASAEIAYERAVEHARRGRDRRREMETLAWWIGAKLHGPTPADEGVKFCDGILRKELGDPFVEAFALEKRGALEAMGGRFDEARASVRRAQGITDEFGLRVRRGINAQYVAYVELLSGDLEAAEGELRVGCDLLEWLGETAFHSSVASALAEVLYRQGRYEEAERFVSADDPDVQALRGKVLARRGELLEAERLARAAVAHLEGYDYLDVRANTLMDLAEVLRLAGRPEEAVPVVREAFGLYTQKGNLVSTERARALLQELGSSAAQAGQALP